MFSLIKVSTIDIFQRSNPMKYSVMCDKHNQSETFSNCTKRQFSLKRPNLLSFRIATIYGVSKGVQIFGYEYSPGSKYKFEYKMSGICANFDQRLQMYFKSFMQTLFSSCFKNLENIQNFVIQISRCS